MPSEIAWRASSSSHVVISVGHRVDPAGFGTVPANIELHQHVPQLAVLAELGVGVHLDFEKVTAASLTDAVAAARQFGTRATALAAEIRAHGGVEPAADAIEDFLE